MDNLEINRRMTYSKPDEGRAARHQRVNEAALAFALAVNELTENGRQQALAITKIEEARMWANAAIAQEVPHADQG